MITLSEDKLTEINKSTYEFERDIIRGGMNPVSDAPEIASQFYMDTH